MNILFNICQEENCIMKARGKGIYCTKHYNINRYKVSGFVLFRVYLRDYKRNRRKIDINYRIIENMRNRLRYAIKFGKKESQTTEYIGCSLDDLRLYLQNQFIEGMSWNNYGRGKGKWSIDHIIPCSKFDLTKEENLKKCFHYTNLQPLWFTENTRKSNKI